MSPAPVVCSCSVVCHLPFSAFCSNYHENEIKGDERLNGVLIHKWTMFPLLPPKDAEIIKVLWNVPPPSQVTVSLYRKCVMGKIQHWKTGWGGWVSLLQQAYLNQHNYRIIIHNRPSFLKTWKFLSDLQNFKLMANYQKTLPNNEPEWPISYQCFALP